MQRKRSTRSGRVKTLPWDQDPVIGARLRVVEAQYGQPLNRALHAVNQWLEKQDKPPISYEQLKTDREHLRQLYAEQHRGALEDHVTNLRMGKAAVERDIHQTPPSQRAQLWAVWLRFQEDEMKVDGTWGAVREPIEVAAEEVSYGPSPQEMLESGEISREDYRAWLLVLHRHTGGHEQGPASHQVVESAALPEPSQPRGPQIKRGSNGHPPSSPPGMAKMGDELPGVVDWKPDGDE